MTIIIGHNHNSICMAKSLCFCLSFSLSTFLNDISNVCLFSENDCLYVSIFLSMNSNADF